ncbi:hypothetical protein ASAP_1265 [Asaia bogorensis]|uniref:Uncharacterized protein n=1 Tax=Asaia bogorensis TaxID=91915 RepID=A0A060QEG5_9PROT|nr:hypothetical protein ASAP_1265 [Asaia bogorensis]
MTLRVFTGTRESVVIRANCLTPLPATPSEKPDGRGIAFFVRKGKEEEQGLP